MIVMPEQHTSLAGAPVQTEFLDLPFDALDLDGALAWIAARTADSAFAYVVTPNVDHMVRLPHLSGDARTAYDSADLCLCDSRVLARLARLVGVTLPVAAGSDLTRLLFDRLLQPGERLCLIGGTPDHVVRLGQLYPGLEIVQHVPPMGLLHDAKARAAAIEAAARAEARIVLVAVGSPQQEVIALEMRRSGIVRGTALCIGASINFLTGEERRAPLIIQKAGMEWAWRLAANPRRLVKRYLVDGPAIFPAVWRWSRARRG